MLLVDDLAAGGTNNLRHTPRGLLTLITSVYLCFISKSLFYTQVNRMSRSRRVLAIGGKQRILRLGMVCIETILFHLDSL